MSQEQKPEPETFVLFSHGEGLSITTGSKDGSIPLNSRCAISHLEKAEVDQGLVAELLRRANTQPDLLEALKYLTTHSPERHEGTSLIPNPDWAAWMEKARAAIAKATA